VRALLARLPLTLRALVLLPLLAAGLDQVRASFVCGPGAQSCLDAAGQGWLGGVGTLVLLAYTLGIAGLLARLARGRSASPWLWILATAGLWAACGGQAVLVSALGTGAALGGGWLALLALGAAAGAVLALALRVLPAVLRAWRLTAPRLRALPDLVLQGPGRTVGPTLLGTTRLARDRAPPAPA
jgi:hypothetical protein